VKARSGTAKNPLDEELEGLSREELVKKVKLMDAQNRAIAQTKAQGDATVKLLLTQIKELEAKSGASPKIGTSTSMVKSGPSDTRDNGKTTKRK